MTSCIVKKCNVVSGGKVFVDGDTVELSEGDAKRLELAGSVVIEKLPEPEAKPDIENPVEPAQEDEPETEPEAKPKRRKARRSKK